MHKAHNGTSVYLYICSAWHTCMIEVVSYTVAEYIITDNTATEHRVFTGMQCLSISLVLLLSYHKDIR